MVRMVMYLKIIMDNTNSLSCYEYNLHSAIPLFLLSEIQMYE